MKMILNNYMEHSKNYVILNLILGIMELLNAPIKLVFMVIPVGVYLISVHFKDYLAIPLITGRMKGKYDMFINSLLLVLFLLAIMIVIVTLGRTLHNKETETFREAFKGKEENKAIIHLIYKRKKGNRIERKIYSHTIPDEWNNKNVYLKILKIFDEHFETDKFITDTGNSRITIMRTKKGFNKSIKEKYFDERLEKGMEEIR